MNNVPCDRDSVCAPIRATTLSCFPKYDKILISERSPFSATLDPGRLILTATAVSSVTTSMPIGFTNPLQTTPNSPLPSVHSVPTHYKHFYVHSMSRIKTAFNKRFCMYY